MRPYEFKQQLQQIKLKLEENQDNSSSNLDPSESIKQLYLQQTKELISQLNLATKEGKQHQIDQIKESDQLYFEAQGMIVKGKVQFTRHGECGVWGQKKFGLNPNSAISEDAVQSMAATNEATKALLSYPDEEPLIAISPMVRAMQTASLIIPKSIKARISVEKYLSENSNAPSGLDVRSYQDLLDVSNKTSFFSLKGVLFFLSRLFYGPNYFETNNQKRQVAAAKIQPFNQVGKDIYKDQQIPQSLDYNGDKIKETQTLINETSEKDLWLIGHGKNFAAFFKSVFGINTEFEYAETKIAYKIKAQSMEPMLYTPPYSLVINQKTGEIEGRYTGIAITNTKGMLKEQEVTTSEKTEGIDLNASPNLM
jgi:hypothetical protein